MQKEYHKHRELIDFFHAVESGFITMSLTEYSDLPAALIPAWQTYKHAIARHKKRNPNG